MLTYDHDTICYNYNQNYYTNNKTTNMGSSQNSIFKRVINFERKKKPKTEQQNTKQNSDVNQNRLSDQEIPIITSLCINGRKDITSDINNIQFTRERLELLCTQLKEVVQNIYVNDKFSNLRYDLTRYTFFIVSM